MNRNIKTEIALAIILIVVVIIGGFIWFEEKQQEQNQTVFPLVKKQAGKANEEKRLSFCEFTDEMLPNDKIEESAMKNEYWKKYVNYRDGYEIDYPSKILSIIGNSFTNATGGYWSAWIGYPDSLGAYGDIIVHCGDIDSALIAEKKSEEDTQKWIDSRDGETEKIKSEIIKKEEININGMQALVISKKLTSNLQAGLPNTKTYYIQYKQDRVIKISGGDEPMFDKMARTISIVSSPAIPITSEKPKINQ